MMPININLFFPRSWNDLDDAKLTFVYKMFAAECDFEEIKVLALFRWNNIKVIAHSLDVWTLEKDKVIFQLTPVEVAEILSDFNWIYDIPQRPARIAKFGKLTAIDAEFLGVAFEKYIVVENLYQGVMQLSRKNKSLSIEDDRIFAIFLDLAKILYPGISERNLKNAPHIAVNIFYWIAALKNFFAKRFSDFFQAVGSDTDDVRMPTAKQLQDAMDAQIRALSKGDVTKEAEILSLDTWRALTELNAQARESKYLESKSHSKS